MEYCASATSMVAEEIWQIEEGFFFAISDKNDQPSNPSSPHVFSMVYKTLPSLPEIYNSSSLGTYSVVGYKKLCRGKDHIPYSACNTVW